MAQMKNRSPLQLAVELCVHKCVVMCVVMCVCVRVCLCDHYITTRGWSLEFFTVGMAYIATLLAKVLIQ